MRFMHITNGISNIERKANHGCREGLSGGNCQSQISSDREVGGLSAKLSAGKNC